MSDLISRSALIAKIKPPAEDDYDHKVSVGFVRKMLLNFANSVPSVDAVEVVRCKDCIYSEDAYECNGFLICPASNMEITGNGFCSYGERKSV